MFVQLNMPPSAIETNGSVLLYKEEKWCFQILAQKLSDYLTIDTVFSEHNKCESSTMLLCGSLLPAPGIQKQLVWSFFQIAELGLSTRGNGVYFQNVAEQGLVVLRLPSSFTPYT